MVEGNGLENRRAGNGTEGSNPSPSAKVAVTICYIQPYLREHALIFMETAS